MKRRLVEHENNGTEFVTIQRRWFWWWIDDLSYEGMQWLIKQLVKRKREDVLVMDKLNVLISYLRELNSIVSNGNISGLAMTVTEERILNTCALIDEEMSKQ